jgi:hypothetical protein
VHKECLNEEEQFKEILNNEEIERIRDPELREIRRKYWQLRHKAFLDESRIPDYKLGEEPDKIDEDEQKEIREYKERYNI